MFFNFCFKVFSLIFNLSEIKAKMLDQTVIDRHYVKYLAYTFCNLISVDFS